MPIQSPPTTACSTTALAQDESAPSPLQLARATSADPRRRASLARAEADALTTGRAGERLQALAAELLGNLLAAGATPELASPSQQEVGPSNPERDVAGLQAFGVKRLCGDGKTSQGLCILTHTRLLVQCNAYICQEG